MIPANMVNAALRESDDHYNFGTAKLPILIRIGDFAQVKKRNSNLTLEEFIGQHSWMGQHPFYPELTGDTDQSINPVALNRLLCDFIRKGEALVILDGLDEINPHPTLIKSIQKFTHDNSQNIHILISCRSNFYLVESEDYSGEIKNFTSYSILSLKRNQIDEYLAKKLMMNDRTGKDINQFPAYLQYRQFPKIKSNQY